ncbi:MAG: (d)CMP kinase, partial [Culicoidibacterales bacterium]
MIQIAIDGTSASGKGTLAKRLADYYQIEHIDTGAMYRAVALYVIEHNIAHENVEAMVTYAN